MGEAKILFLLNENHIVVQFQLKTLTMSAVAINALNLRGSKLSSSAEPPNVCLETTMGKVVVELYWRHAPKTCRNFAELARRGYYDGVKFHRIIADFMIQGGDP